MRNKSPFSPIISPRKIGENSKKVAQPISVGSNEENNSRKCLNRTLQFRHFLHSFGGEGGIRTRVRLPANWFRVSPVMTTSIPLRIYLNTILSPAAEKPAQKKSKNLGRFRGENDKRFYSIVPQKHATYKEFRAGGYRIATRISSQARYDHFDTLPYFARR